MRRRHVYLALLAVLTVCTLLKSQKRFTYESVEKGSTAAFWQPDWFSIISGEINRRRIHLRVDGQEITEKRFPVRMSAEGHFLIPLPLLAKGFSCSAHVYGGKRLVMERGVTRAEIDEGSRELSVNGKTVSLETELVKEDGLYYLPLSAVEQAFSYKRDWNAAANTMELTYTGRETGYLPDRYDYREAGRAPQVKNQGSLGTCWAFASLMALESRLLPEQNVSFSEDHMSLRNSFHMDQNAGGEYTMSMAYLLAWQGPVLEEQDVYGDGYSPPGLKPVCHVQEIQVLPSKDYEAIKRAVYLYGGVQSSLYTSMVTGKRDSRYYNKSQGAYYYNGNARPNHDVVIIGWDDGYARENFSVAPEADGAFICANSWGGEFGDEGYFYVSYYDVNIGIHNVLYSRVDETDRFHHIYQSDLCGWVGQLGYGRENAYFANVYTAGRGEELAAAGFYATGPDTSYEVYVVTGFEGSAQLGRRRLMASGKLESAGFYTIDFDSPVALADGEKFAVIVNIATPGSVHPVAIEYNSPDKKLKADISDGEGYISFRGTSWERVEESQKCNVCLKAYTRDREREEKHER
ncbi:lectin like domain-containing protein [Otoolea muris]|uniref:lectin like domain-containing protein n=1 Tax=Otoolea muris TaxID=2941515 RepID=UPI00203CB90E|nr:lectin like domain-containing protein [Otoolea muris]